MVAWALLIPSAGSGAQAQECSQPSPDGCPVTPGEPVRAALASPDEVHMWLLEVPSVGDIRAVLTDLSADYDLHVFAGDGSPVGGSVNEGTEDDRVGLQAAQPGVYALYVNSPRGEVAEASYTLLVQLDLASASAPTGPWKLLRADDFSDPARGLFLDRQQGTSRTTFSSGATYQYNWEYGYQDGSLVARVRGPYPTNPDGAWVGVWAPAADKVWEDFAVEVKARATRSAAASGYTIIYLAPPDHRYEYQVRAGDAVYSIWSAEDNRTLAIGRTGAANRGSEENHLRLEVRGDTMTIFLNGQLIDRAQHSGLAARDGALVLASNLRGLDPDVDLEVRFTDFKVLAWQP